MILRYAETIGENIGTGLNQIRYRLDAIDKKSRPNNDMPEWWISARWKPSDSEKDENEEERGGNDPIIDDTNNDRPNNDPPPLPPPPPALINAISVS